MESSVAYLSSLLSEWLVKLCSPNDLLLWSPSERLLWRPLLSMETLSLTSAWYVADVLCGGSDSVSETGIVMWSGLMSSKSKILVKAWRTRSFHWARNLVKQGDNALVRVCLSVCPSVTCSCLNHSTFVFGSGRPWSRRGWDLRSRL